MFGDAVQADHLILNAWCSSPFVATARIDEDELLRTMSRQGELAYDGPPTDGVRNGEVVLASALMPAAEYRQTAHYNELIRPLGGYYGIFGKATAAATGSSLFVCRSHRRPEFEQPDADIVTALMPHLSLAIALGARMGPAGPPPSSVGLLESFQGAALICDDCARLLTANGAARRLIEASDGIVLSGARLAATNPAQTQRLREAIAFAALATDSSGKPGMRMRLQRRRGRLALSLRLVPVGQLGSAIGDPRSVAMFITEPDAASPIDRAALTEAYGLAPREAELACMLASGASLADIAAATGLTVGTLRGYL